MTIRLLLRLVPCMWRELIEDTLSKEAWMRHPEYPSPAMRTAGAWITLITVVLVALCAALILPQIAQITAYIHRVAP